MNGRTEAYLSTRLNIAWCAVVLGNFDSVALVGQSRLQFLGGAVQPVLASSDGTIIVGPARVISSNIPTRNGVVHIINKVLAGDASINATAVAIAAKLGDFGPFNRTKASFTPHLRNALKGLSQEQAWNQKRLSGLQPSKISAKCQG